MFMPEAVTCHCCKKLLDVQCVRAGCCAKAQATNGHYAVARTLLHVAKVIDPTTTKEEVSTGADRLRPGGITTSAAIGGQRLAINIGITFEARRTPLDPVYQYALEKVQQYRHLIDGDET